MQGIPTVTGASMVGYVVGKMSYRSTMEDRFLKELPDSNFARLIRIKRKLEEPPRYGTQLLKGGTPHSRF